MPKKWMFYRSVSKIEEKKYIIFHTLLLNHWFESIWWVGITSVSWDQESSVDAWLLWWNFKICCTDGSISLKIRIQRSCMRKILMIKNWRTLSTLLTDNCKSFILQESCFLICTQKSSKLLPLFCAGFKNIFNWLWHKYFFMLILELN